MKTKPIVTVVLLGFVAASVAALIIKETRNRPVAAAPPPSETPAALAESPAPVVAYYFHGQVRCQTCLAIERQAKQAIETGFADDLKAQPIVFKPVNVDEPENRHFVQDFQLETRSLVLVSSRAGQPPRYKTLGQVWTLVHNPPAFTRYVTDEVQQFLTETP